MMFVTADLYKNDQRRAVNHGLSGFVRPKITRVKVTLKKRAGRSVNVYFCCENIFVQVFLYTD